MCSYLFALEFSLREAAGWRGRGTSYQGEGLDRLRPRQGKHRHTLLLRHGGPVSRKTLIFSEIARRQRVREEGRSLGRNALESSVLPAVSAKDVHATKRLVSDEAHSCIRSIFSFRSQQSRITHKKASHLSIGKMNLSIVCSNVCHRCGELSNHTESSSTTPSQKSTTLPMFEVKHVGTTEPVSRRSSQTRGGNKSCSSS